MNPVPNPPIGNGRKQKDEDEGAARFPVEEQTHCKQKGIA